MKFLLSSVLLLSFVASNAIACSFAPGYFTFEATPSKFQTKMDEGHIALLPAPVASVKSISRGKAAPGASCEDAGIIELIITWPHSPYGLEEVGFYFQSDNGFEPDLIFPLGPVTGEIKGNQASFMFVWLDGHPKHQKKLDFNVNVFAVNKGLQVGQPTTVNIKAKKG
ncbi:MAG: hypothetical protein GY702_13870 [Desulfobulbaceae bacterium]|nr:hypothetical protein [Desulfobulbaceae bacterium]